MIASSAIQFLFSARLSLLRRIITPTVGGTVIMLIAVNVFPICTDMLARVPEGVDPRSWAGPLAAFATFGVILLVSLFSSGQLTLWAPLLGIIAGCAVAGPTGLLDPSGFLDSAWFGLPDSGWPGLDLSFDGRFFGLLPAFLIVTVIGAVETYGDGIAIQRVAHHQQRPVDFKAVQGAVNADGLGNLLSGILGTVPNTTYSTSISVADLTRVASRRVALYGGAIIVAAAFLPRIAGLLRSVPDAVAGAYLLILIVLLFAQGLRMVFAGGLSTQNGLIVCLSFWLGVGFQYQVIFPDHLPGWTRGLLDNGMASGGIVALALTALVSLKRRRGDRVLLKPSLGSMADLREFLDGIATSSGWDKSATDRLQLAGEEALLYLIDRHSAGSAGANAATIRLSARPEAATIELEFVSGPDAENLEARLDALADTTPVPEEAGPRILRHMSKEVRHEQFHDHDFLTVVVDSRPLG